LAADRAVAFALAGAAFFAVGAFTVGGSAVRPLLASQAAMSAMTWSVPGSSMIQWALLGYSR
jgi:hypothetical protein